MKIVCILAATLMLCGCGESPSFHNNIKYESGNEIPKLSNGYCIYIIDGCQYVSWGKCFSHKGNCTNKIHIYNK